MSIEKRSTTPHQPKKIASLSESTSPLLKLRKLTLRTHNYQKPTRMTQNRLCLQIQYYATLICYFSPHEAWFGQPPKATAVFLFGQYGVVTTHGEKSKLSTRNDVAIYMFGVEMFHIFSLFVWQLKNFIPFAP